MILSMRFYEPTLVIYPFAGVKFTLFVILSHGLPLNWMKLKMKFVRIKGDCKFSNVMMK